MKTLDFRWASASIAVAALFLLSSPVALADENDQVAKLYKQGNLTKALEQADAYLTLKPKDAQMRFHKGLILTEQKKSAEAIRIFSSLAEEFPDLPEPYNNLAVLYASQGQYDKAKGALEAAIRTHPSYATAHENLGDIYAKMASQAYGKALQLDKDNAAAQTKLAMIKDVFTGRPKEIQVATASPPASLAPPNNPPANPPAAAPGKASGKMEEKPEEKVEKPEAKKLAVAETSSLEQSAGPDDLDEILQVVNAWAKAWSAKDIGGYLAFYASSFRPNGALSRTAWEKSRRERVTKPKAIHVAIANPKVSFTDATHAKVSFKQSYHSDAIRSNTAKTLEMVKTGEKWLIQQERVGR
ncbi:tetratricopeptide repeat protein [Nitrosospira briensis]|uniref:tetratricopeptide repeat protein n=1 Tax=Nitrosospira briensis TaxID=35799 RepID=UPI0008E3AD13|nr:tetratricopeptide repeat protein [Nitrosospira briensis]SFO20620.1 Flp pilus assembly protein TadD, contains TPR repeats [Nitrosospira briensis]